VLFGDGHVEFEMNPFVGVKRDNIYTFGDNGIDHPKSGGDGIVGASVGPDDSVLLPTSVDLGLIDKEGRLTAAGVAIHDRGVGREAPPAKELEAAVGKVAGTYMRDDGSTLTIAKDKLTFTGGGKTVAYDFRVPDLAPDGGVRMSVTGSDGFVSETVTVWLDGKTLFVTGNPQLAGKWTRQ
jgi:hypothetical protein